MEIKKWEELEITDDFLFGKVMRNPDICKRTVETILGIKIDRKFDETYFSSSKKSRKRLFSSRNS